MLSEEEEAALLAEYGVLGLDDALVTVPAASHFRSDYGDAAVFLTGAGDAEPDDDDDNGRSPSLDLLAGDGSSLRASQYPLDALLFKHTDLLTASAPSALTGALGTALGDLRGGRDSSYAAPTGRTDYAAVLRQGRSMAQRTAQIASGALSKDVDLTMVTAARDNTLDTTGAVETESGDTEEVQRAAKLLAEAEAAMAMSTKPDPTTDTLLQARLDNAARDVARLYEDAYDALLERRDVLDDDDNDADTAGLLAACAANTATWRTALDRLADKPAVSDRTQDEAPPDVDVVAAAPAPVMAAMLPPSLFAFDMALTRAEEEAADAWTLADDNPSPPPVEPAESVAEPIKSPPLFALTVAVKGVLQSIEHIDERDDTEEKQARQSLRRAIEAHHAKDKAATTAALRERTGMVSLEAFVKRVDELLPPVAHETELRERHAHATHTSAPASAVAPPTSTDAVPCVVSAEPTVPAVTSATESLEMVQRRAARDLAAIQLAAMEGRRMREEDARMQNWMDWLQDRREEIDRLLIHCAAESESTRLSIASEEATAFKDLRIAEQRQLLLLRQAQRVRWLKATAQVAEDMLGAHAEHAAVIESEEAEAFTRLSSTWWHASAQLYARLVARYVDASQSREKRFARLGWADLVLPTEATPLRRIPYRAACTETGDAWQRSVSRLVFDGTQVVPSRIEALNAEEKALSVWLRAHRDDVEASLRAAADALAAIRRRIRERRHWRPPQHMSRPPTGTSSRGATSPPPSDKANASTGAAAAGPSTVLNDTLFRDLQALTFAAAQADLLRAPQYLYSLSFALEHLEDVDYASVAATELLAETDEQRQRRRLLSASVHASELVRDLNLGSNAFTALSLVELLEAFPSLARLTLSDNAVASLASRRPATAVSGGAATARSVTSASVRGVAAARENALADACSLSELDLSSNRLTELAAVGRLLYVSLRTLRVSANALTTLDGLSSCAALSTVDASRNPLTSLAGLEQCRVLQELNVCDTKVGDVATLAGKLLFLQCLYASQTAVHAFPPSGQVLLTLTQLFLNHCGLRAIPADTGAVMPFLSIFHAEGNRLTTVAGLAHCLRLITVNIASNQLCLPDAVAPLRVCAQLQSLDVRHNGDSPDATTISGRVLAWFPQLTELNAEAVRRTAPSQALLVAAHCRTWQRTWAVRATPRRPEQSAHLASLLAHDSLLCDARAALEVCVVDTKARLRAARDSDDALAQRFASRQRPPLSAYQLSMEEEERGAAARLAQSVSSVEAVTGRPGNTSTAATAQNTVVACPAYWRRAQQFAQGRAKDVLAEWLYGLVCVRRAQAELAARRRVYRESESFRRDAAARRIQPVWRGAVLRSRLRRIVGATASTATGHLLLGDDDDDAFVKVDDTFDMPELPDSTMGMLFQKVLQQHTEALPAFSVPQTIPGLATGATTNNPTATAQAAGTADVLSFDDASNGGGGPRAGTAPLAGNSGPRGAGGKRVLPVLSDPARPSSMMAQSQMAPPSTETLEEQWGNTVAAQIRKKNKKMQTVHQQHVREQFMRDPLGTKKQQHMNTKTTK